MVPVYLACAIAFVLTTAALKGAFDIPWVLAFALNTMFTLIIVAAIMAGALIANPSLRFP